jgi:hypothetical protein
MQFFEKIYFNFIKEWADYDEKGKCSVGIYEFSHRFEKA